MSDKAASPVASSKEPIEPSTTQAPEADAGAKSTDIATDDAQADNKSSNVDDAVPTEEQVKADAPNDANDQASNAKDVEMTTREKAEDAPAAGTDSAQQATPAGKDKKRRSSGVPEHKGRRLSKKQSKAKLTNLDAKAGEYYFAKSKGSQPWPSMIADLDMMPEELTKKPLVSAMKADGTWNPNYADGGKAVNDRTFPVLFLGTNEFGWVKNTELVELDTDTILDKIVPSMKGRLKEAHEAAAEKHDLQHYKDLVAESKKFAEEEEENRRIAAEEKAAKEEAKKAKAEEKKAAGSTKAKKKSDETVADDDQDEDTEMADGDLDVEEPKSKSKKRKADADDASATPKQSAKKPKIKINNNNKAEGAATPKSTTKKEPKSSAKKTKKTNGAANGDATVKEAELTEDEKRQKKEKEILFFRHRLQKGLLTKEQAPKEEEMASMSGFITRLEEYAEIEVSIIRSTKINKVMKAILKLDEIPKEDEFKFKPRSQALLEKWNKILDGAAASDAKTGEAAANGEEKEEVAAKTSEPEVKADTAAPAEEKTNETEAATKPAETESKDAPAQEEKKDVEMAEAKDEEFVPPTAAEEEQEEKLEVAADGAGDEL